MNIRTHKPYNTRIKSSEQIWRERNPNAKLDYENRSSTTLYRKFYNSPEWKRLRKDYYEGIPPSDRVCHWCGSQDRVLVDHIQCVKYYYAKRLDIRNLHLLCWPCHAIATREQEQEAQRLGLVPHDPNTEEPSSFEGWEPAC